MEIFHVLNGDALLEKFPRYEIPGDIIICRECLIDGPVSSESNEEFWKIRNEYLTKAYPEVKENYYSRVVSELNKINEIPEGSEVNLWFENDLLCQVNMWFILSLVKNKFSGLKLCRVFPEIKNPDDTWKGFGISDKQDLVRAYVNRKQFTEESFRLGLDLWNAFAENNFNNLKHLSEKESKCFQHLSIVCEASIQRYTPDKKSGRPIKTLMKILSEGDNDFYNIFSKFAKEEAVYGFGDLQVKRMMEEINTN